MEEIYANVEYEKPVDARPRPTCQTAPESSGRRFYRAVVLLLGLLSVVLLAGIIALGVHCHATKDTLTELLQDREKQLSSLNANLTETTEELQRLHRLSKQKKTCPAGWKMFHCSCYLFSRQTKTWDGSRQDCRNRGADLVIVDSLEEQEFLTNNISNLSENLRLYWIGLSDRDNEGTWKWTDGTPLTQAYWWAGQPDNGGGDPRFGEEDCGQIVSDREKEKNWNDENCGRSRRWICEN